MDITEIRRVFTMPRDNEQDLVELAMHDEKTLLVLADFCEQNNDIAAAEAIRSTNLSDLINTCWRRDWVTTEGRSKLLASWAKYYDFTTPICPWSSYPYSREGQHVLLCPQVLLSSHDNPYVNERSLDYQEKWQTRVTESERMCPLCQGTGRFQTATILDALGALAKYGRPEPLHIGETLWCGVSDYYTSRDDGCYWEGSFGETRQTADVHGFELLPLIGDTSRKSPHDSNVFSVRKEYESLRQDLGAFWSGPMVWYRGHATAELALIVRWLWKRRLTAIT